MSPTSFYEDSMERYGLIGYPVEHSVSPAMHNAAFKELGIDAKYELFSVKPEELEDFILNRKDVRGFNITLPHKVRAKEIIDRNNPLDVAAADKYYVEVSGAINTVKREDGRLRYKNTDPIGFRHSLESDLGIRRMGGKNVLVIGCGGAGRAIIADLSRGNQAKRIYVYDKSKKAAASAKKHFLNSPKIEFISQNDIKEKIKESYLLVNTSPVGMKEGDDVSVVDKSILALNKKLFVYDVIYNRQTGLIREAKKLGLSACGGRGMLAAQGAFSFSFWTGVKPADVIDVMRRALDKELDNA